MPMLCSEGQPGWALRGVPMRAGLWGRVMMSGAPHIGLGVEGCVGLAWRWQWRHVHRRAGKSTEGQIGRVRGWFLQWGRHHVGAQWRVPELGGLLQRCVGGLGPRPGGQRLLLFLKAPSTLRGVLLYLVAEGHPPSSHLCDDF